MKPARPHVLMIADAAGGVWTHVLTLSHGMIALGWHVTLAQMGPSPSADQLRQVPSEHFDLIRTGLALEWQDPAGHGMERARRVLLGLAARLRPDLVHLHSFREALLRWEMPIVLTAHSCVRTWWITCRHDEPPPAWKPYVARVKSALASADAWTAPTAAFARAMEASYKPSRPAMVIHNGSELEARISAARFGVFASGRLWDEAKNINLLLQAAETMPAAVRLAGPLNAPGSATGITLPQHVRWLGTLGMEGLARAHGQAALYCSPSRYEPFGLGVLEAARSGAGLVLSAIPSHLELWDGAALFFDPDEADALARLLMELAARPDLVTTLQAAAHERARRYTCAALCAAHDHLYRRVLRWPEGGP